MKKITIEINFNKKIVLKDVDNFFHYGINFDAHYDEIEIIEDALIDTHRKLMEALRGSTHNHKRNMIYTLKRLIEKYESAFIHLSGYYDDCVKKICLKRYEDNKELIEKVSKIVNQEHFTHRDHDILLRPYYFDLDNNLYTPCTLRYKRVRKEIEKKIIELVLSWIAEDLEVEKTINSSVLKIIKEVGS